MTSEVWDERYRHATRASDVMVVLAEDSCGVTLDYITTQRWAELMMIMREVDTKADTTPADEILADLASFARFRERYSHLSPEQFGQDEHTALGVHTIRILRLGERMAKATTPLRYQAFRRHEAIETAKTFGLVATSEVKNQPAFQVTFLPLLARIAVAASYLDTVLDAKRDLQDGIIQFKLPWVFKMKLLAATGKEMARDGRYFLKPRVAFAYTKMCVRALKSHHELEVQRDRDQL